ncbi:MAG: hypothetical protein GF329_21275 [Candidatus Lokiarchaeota archaeon]|nr:hypothetical protein [Candidatus Lokiarchaeota archaeon]
MKFRKKRKDKDSRDKISNIKNFHELDIKERPLIDKIILPTDLWLKALKIGRQTFNEVGFYMVGLFRGRTCYVYNLIEFEYEEQSGAFIESGLRRAIRLGAGLPSGLKIIGNMHKHPGFLSYSRTDRRDYLRYGRSHSQNAFLIYIVEPYDKIAGYTATEDRIHEIEVDIRDLDYDEELIEKNISIEIEIKMNTQKKDKVKTLKYNLIDQLSPEILKHFSRSDLYENGERIPRHNQVMEIGKNLSLPSKKPVFLKGIGFKKEMAFRIFLGSTDTLFELKDALMELIKLEISDYSRIKFFSNDEMLPDHTRISEINSVLNWKIEKKPVKEFSLKFFHDLFTLISNISISRVFWWNV